LGIEESGRRQHPCPESCVHNSRQVIKRLEDEGWALARIKGSHHQFKHPVKPGLVTVKHPDSDIPAGTLHNIRRVGVIEEIYAISGFLAKTARAALR
jgi:predicted RNA binding protein YcfA (HicA-like mRNA interferase family)